MTVTEPGLDAAGRTPAGAREIGCPLCGVTGGSRLRGYNRKAGRKVFEVLGLPAGAGQWTALCRTTDVPLRGARVLGRRLEGRTRWAEFDGIARVTTFAEAAV